MEWTAEAGDEVWAGDLCWEGDPYGGYEKSCLDWDQKSGMEGAVNKAQD